MHAISSYRGNRPTKPQTHRQDQLQYTALLANYADTLTVQYGKSAVMFDNMQQQ